MTSWLFWLLWGIDALVCAIIVVFFSRGTMTGSVSAFNIGTWIAILAALAVVIGGSLWLKMHGHPGFGIILLLVLAIPSLLYGLIVVLTVVTRTSWN